MTERHTTVEDPAAELAFRRAYRRGWLAAVDAFGQLLADRGLPAQRAAQVLRDHHSQALARWEKDRAGLALYPPRVRGTGAGHGE